ncbi:MAG TPA: hypothetical protein VMT38_05505 [Terracidiphilus sp.]|nr:hypothetical protein [Terracidiphilus sp.]
MKHAYFSVFVLAAIMSAQQPPQSMTKMMVQLAGTDIARDSFAAKPKIFYRAGTTYCRVEEQPDPENGIHGLVIINEPDIWMVNLADQTARHYVDDGPTFNCHMPIFGDRSSGMPKEVATQIGALEFGFEMEFFKGHGAVREPGPVLQIGGQPVQTNGYRLHFGDWMVALFTGGDVEKPAAVAMFHGEEHFTYYYAGYDLLPFDATLFAKPSGVKIEEEKN